MNSRLHVSVAALALSTALLSPARLVAQAPHYKVTDLGPAGNPFSVANFLNNHGWVTGSATAADGTSHAVLWYKNLFLDLKQITDINHPGLLGSNSAAGPVNESGQVIVGAETQAPDPNHENFCGFGTSFQCAVFLWSNGVMTQLPNPLGGPNSNWGGINRRGEIAGWAESTTRDPECLATAPNGTGPQVLDYQAVVWGPGPNQFRQLTPLPGDTVSMALAINDAGQVVGVSGGCGNTVTGFGTAGPHAVLWGVDGTPHDLGSFGGSSNPAILAVGNGAFAINNRGEVAGTSAAPGDQVNEPFLWTKQNKMQHLKLLPGNVVGAGLDINARGEVVGASITAGGLASGDPSAVVWLQGADGDVTDLNTFLTEDSPFIALLTAFGINDSGKIVGFGATSDGEIHAFLAVPDEADAADRSPSKVRRQVMLSDKTRRLLRTRFVLRK